MRKAKLAVLAIVMVLVVAVAPMGVFAASGLNDYESKLLDEARAALGNITMSSVQSANANGYLSQAESYFSRDDVDVTEAQYNTCSSAIAKAASILPGDVSAISVKELYKNSSELSAIANEVGTALGITISISSDGAISIIKGSDTVGSTGGTVQQTGFGTEYLAVVFAAFAVIVAACAVVAKRKNLFAHSAE